MCLCFVCVLLLFSVTLTPFQRRRRSAYTKRTAKSVKPKAKSYKFLSAKQSAAKKLAAAKKKRHGYQATAPVKAAYLGVKEPVDPVRTHQDISSASTGKSLMLVWTLPNSPCPDLHYPSLPRARLDLDGDSLEAQWITLVMSSACVNSPLSSSLLSLVLSM